MPTAPTTRRGRRRPLSPVTVTGRLTVFATGRAEVFTAVSTDDTWTYEHEMEEVGTPWYATHVPTGEVQVFPTLRSARAWTASPAALQLLRTVAFDVLLSDYTSAFEKGRARRTLMVLDGTLLPASADVDAVCLCGGFLAHLADGRWLHVDTCDEELHLAADGMLCPEDRNRHTVCDQPAPVQCDHPTCLRPNNTNALGCEYGHDACCGSHPGER